MVSDGLGLASAKPRLVSNRPSGDAAHLVLAPPALPLQARRLLLARQRYGHLHFSLSLQSCRARTRIGESR
ncbi:unnamed protein product [Peniophora sp. CBMAI 1063]|nr:unnamed protein product [Peniophora sp. CBMAI 1063]